MIIREAKSSDFAAIWPIFHQIAVAGDTYAYPSDISYDQAQQEWMSLPVKTFVVEEDGQILGTYYIKTNQAGAGDHETQL